jgi:hypothetical protein
MSDEFKNPVPATPRRRPLIIALSRMAVAAPVANLVAGGRRALAQTAPGTSTTVFPSTTLFTVPVTTQFPPTTLFTVPVTTRFPPTTLFTVPVTTRFPPTTLFTVPVTTASPAPAPGPGPGTTPSPSPGTTGSSTGTDAPEPTSLALLGTGLAIGGGSSFARRIRNKIRSALERLAEEDEG